MVILLKIFPIFYSSNSCFHALGFIEVLVSAFLLDLNSCYSKIPIADMIQRHDCVGGARTDHLLRKKKNLCWDFPSHQSPIPWPTSSFCCCCCFSSRSDVFGGNRHLITSGGCDSKPSSNHMSLLAEMHLFINGVFPLDLLAYLYSNAFVQFCASQCYDHDFASIGVSFGSLSREHTKEECKAV